MERRPHRSDWPIRMAALNEILPQIAEWLGEPIPDRDVPLILDAASLDAYDFARHLDDSGWSPDAELVEILQGYDTYGAHRDAVKDWVRANGITIPFAIGDLVSLRRSVAKIVKLNPETAEIVAQPVITQNGDRSFGEFDGWVHPFEDAAPVRP